MPESRAVTPPFRALPQAQRLVLLAVLAVGVVAVGVLMRPYGRTMTEQTSPRGEHFGIVAFETAGPEKARTILATWGDEGQDAARAQIRIDYVWLILYASALAVACTALGAALGGAWQRLGTATARLALITGALDAVENTALLRVLAGDPDPGARAAQSAAYAKFALVAVVLAYLVIGLAPLALHLRRRHTARKGA